MRPAGAVRRLRGDGRDRRVGDPRDDVEVVRREVLHDADVAHAFGERADPLGRDEEHVAELARQHPLAQRDQRRVEALDVPDRGTHAGALARRDDLLALLDRGRERLLDQQVHAGLREPQRGRQVLLRRQRDDRHVERVLAASSSSSVA